MRLLGSKYAKNAFAAGAPSRTPLGSSESSPRSPSWILGPFAAGIRRGGKEREREGKGEEGRGGDWRGREGKGVTGKETKGREGRG